MKMYLILSAEKTEFLKACKRFKVKFNELPHYVNSNPLFIFKIKKDAIEWCKKHNNFKAESEIDFLRTYDKTYYFKEITLY